MRVEIKIEPNSPEPYAVISVPKLTPNVMAAIELLENEQGASALLAAKRDGSTFVLELDNVEIIRTEGGHLRLYDRSGSIYELDGPLNDVQKRVSKQFIRISKSALVNTSRVDHVAPSFNGTMDIVMKNGVTDYISRKYLRDFKTRLGM